MLDRHGCVLNMDADGSCAYHSPKIILVAEGLIVTSLPIAQLREMILDHGENNADLFLGKNLMGDDTVFKISDGGIGYTCYGQRGIQGKCVLGYSRTPYWLGFSVSIQIMKGLLERNIG